MEGVSEEANEIYLELAPENLVKALKTAQSAKWIKIKLAKKHTPCLTVEVDLVGIVTALQAYNIESRLMQCQGVCSQ